MRYTITSDTVGLAIGPVSETAGDVQEALTKARQMCETGLANVSIEDEGGHKIDGDELLACIAGKKKITQVTCGQFRVAANDLEVLHFKSLQTALPRDHG